MRVLLTALCSTSLLAAPVAACPRQAAAAEGSRIELHDSAALDLYFSARAASAPEHAPAPPALAPVVAAVRALDQKLGGSPLAWAPLDGCLPGCETAADVRAAFEGAPASVTVRGGASVELRAPALAIADALVAAEEALAPLSKEHRARVAVVRKSWQEGVGAREGELIAYHLASLGMSDPGLVLPVFLVADAPWPGAVTVRDAEGRGVSFVGANAATGSALLEVILHEVTHSLDLAAGERSALGELRTKLAKAGLDPRDRRLFDLPHGLMFVQSAASIRHVVAPDHRDYGESEDVYLRLGPSAEALRGLWTDHLEGKLGREEALDGIVASLEGR